MSPQQNKNKSPITLRRLARLAAVQGLYQSEVAPEPVEIIIQRFHDDPSVLLTEEQSSLTIDTTLLATILLGIKNNRDDIDALIVEALDGGRSMIRLEQLLRAILRAGVFELLYCPDTPKGIIVNDYVDVTHSFFGAKEPALVNAILDKLAKKLRDNA